MFVFFYVLLPLSIWGNVFLHNPRGSNNRGCETGEDRANSQKLFRSENIGKGGYACPWAWPFACYRLPVEADREACNQLNRDQDYDNITGIMLDDEGGVTHERGTRTPKMYFYEGSQLQIEWTNGQGCGDNPRTRCDIIIQYACEDTLADDCGETGSGKVCGPRDGRPITNSNTERGSATYTNYFGTGTSSVSRRQRDRESVATIPLSTSHNVQQDLRFGRHESLRYFEKCYNRERNKGVWIGDVGVGDRATSTRQSSSRFGLECMEESNYYPYWAPSPWKDIAILTDRVSECGQMVANSQNVVNKFECQCPTCPSRNLLVPNDHDNCLSKGGSWVSVPAHNVAAPYCGLPPSTRENHLGNPFGGGKSASAFNWTVPPALENSKSCVIRIRYNVTTLDETTANSGIPVSIYGTFVQNAQNSPIKDRRGNEAKSYVNSLMPGNRTKLGLETNTRLIGRTFQDRSYVFSIRSKPVVGSECFNKMIHNLNVRGKRGNIVQTFPAVEYDFTPNELYVDDLFSCVHVQWTGSDYNPARNSNDAYGGPPDPNDLNDGRADRHNMVQIYQPHEYQAVVSLDYDWYMFYTTRQRKVNLAWIGQPIESTEECMTIDSILALSGQARADNDLPEAQRNPLFRDNGNNFLDDNNDRDRYYKNCGKLSAAKTPYFDGGLFVPGPPGKYAYMSTRGNSFSNRNQQGILIVQSGLLTSGLVVVVAGSMAGLLGLAGLIFVRRRSKKQLLPEAAMARSAVKSMAVSALAKRAKPNTKQVGATAITQVTALYDHVPGETGELAFKRGDVITVLNQDDPGWWEGRSPSGERGIFPSNYVQQ